MLVVKCSLNFKSSQCSLSSMPAAAEKGGSEDGSYTEPTSNKENESAMMSRNQRADTSAGPEGEDDTRLSGPRAERWILLALTLDSRHLDKTAPLCSPLGKARRQSRHVITKQAPPPIPSSPAGCSAPPAWPWPSSKSHWTDGRDALSPPRGKTRPGR